MRPTKENNKTVEEVLAERNMKEHSHENEIKCVGKDCIGKEHVMKPVSKNRVKCSDCGEERLLVKPHPGLRECPGCGEFVPKVKHYDECPYCGTEIE